MNILETNTTQTTCEHLYGGRLLLPSSRCGLSPLLWRRGSGLREAVTCLRSHSWEEAEVRFSPRAPRSSRGCQAAEGARVGMEVLGRRVSEFWGWGWRGRTGEGHLFRLSFPVMHTLGSVVSTPSPQARERVPGAPLGGRCPTKRDEWMLITSSM